MNEIVLLTVNSLINDKEYDKALDQLVKMTEKLDVKHKTEIFESFLRIINECIQGLQEAQSYVSVFKCFKSAIKLFPFKLQEIHKNMSRIMKIPFTQVTDEIEAVLRKRLPRKHWQKHFKQLAIQISVVVIGAKRSFLWDIGPVQTLINESTIETIKEINVQLKSNLQIITMNDEIFIFNQRLFPIDATEHVFIDVSKDLPTPRFINNSETTKMLVVQKLNSQIENNSSSIIEIKVTPSDCIPCMSGLLIGYPVVYFYDERSNGENCLQDVCLTVKQIKMKDFVITSFSLPLEIFEANAFIKDVIQQWRLMLMLVPELTFECFNKTLNVVIL